MLLSWSMLSCLLPTTPPAFLVFLSTVDSVCLLIVCANGRWNELLNASCRFTTGNRKSVASVCVSVVKFRSEWVRLVGQYCVQFVCHQSMILSWSTLSCLSCLIHYLPSWCSCRFCLLVDCVCEWPITVFTLSIIDGIKPGYVFLPSPHHPTCLPLALFDLSK